VSCARERKRKRMSAGMQRSRAGGVPVRVMLPLNTLDSSGQLSEQMAATLMRRLRMLAAVGVTGVSLDVWHGLCEPSPRHYEFRGVAAVVQLARSLGLTTSAIMSFHACGGGPGDDVDIPLPAWLRDAAIAARAFCESAKGLQCLAALSPGADAVQLHGRTPPEICRDFVAAFAAHMRKCDLFGARSGGVVEIHMGLGPCGELRWPAYDPPLQWEFPGCGAFMCYDPHCTAFAQRCGVTLPDWEICGAPSAPPEKWPLFCKPLVSSVMFAKFRAWYCDLLLDHGERLLSAARDGLSMSFLGNAPRGDDGGGVMLCAKLAGIHWLHDAPVRAAEITAGYAPGQYDAIADRFRKVGVRCIFTCFEKRAIDEPLVARSNPEALLREVQEACLRQGVAEVDAENATDCLGDAAALGRIVERCAAGGVGAFTFLRLTPALVGEDESFLALHPWLAAATAGGATAAALTVIASHGSSRGTKVAVASALLLLFAVAAKEIWRSFARPSVPSDFVDFVAKLRAITTR